MKEGLRLPKTSSQRPLLILAAISLALGLVFTWPLARDFLGAIPYSLNPAPGFERAPLMPGDHLQTYYWYWLLSDNLLGPSHLFSNPYEFNGASGPMVGGYANFPWSVLYVPLALTLGPIGAYNALLLLSFLLCGLAGFLLARACTGDAWASLLAGLVLAAAPFRVSQAVAGQMFGLVAFLLPLTLFFIERALASARALYGWAAGACLLAMAPLEPHLTFFTALTVGIYLPGRLLTSRRQEVAASQGAAPTPAPGRPWAELAAVVAAGLALALAAALALTRHQPTASPWAAWLFWPLATGAAWLILSSLAARLTLLFFAAARRQVAFCFLAWTPLALYALQPKLDIPHLGGALAFLCGLLFLGGLARIWLRWRDRLISLDWPGLRAAGIGLAAGLALASAYLLSFRASTMLGSLAGKGRALREILLYAPKPQGLWQLGRGPDERYIFLGLAFLALALLGLLPLLGRAPRDPGRRALAGGLAFLAAVLCLGPDLPGFPLYRLLYDHLPFFNYPRVPARYIAIAFVFLGLLSAYALSGLRQRIEPHLGPAKAKAVLLVLSLLALVEYIPNLPVGLCLLGPANAVQQALAQAPATDGRVLELPLWPGDSHQTSAYEYTVTRTRRPMVNGYSPVVSRQYIDQVFWPLSGLNLGQLDQPQAEVLHRLKAGLLTFHDDYLVYPPKVSPFPPGLARKRLEASGWLAPLAREGNVHLYRLRPSPEPVSGPRPSEITSPVTAVWYAQNLHSLTGRRLFSENASGFALELAEGQDFAAGGRRLRRGAVGNLLQALPGRDQPGHLAWGPGALLPPGRYLARFRLQAGAADRAGEIGAVAIGLKGQAQPLARLALNPGDFPDPRAWMDVPLAFALADTSWVEARVDFNGRAPLALNLVLIDFADQRCGPGVLEAEDLLRQGGVVAPDPAASGGLAVLAHGLPPLIWVMHGPYRTLEPGAYRARFFLRSPGPVGDAPLVLLQAATDLGRRVFAWREVSGREVAGPDYHSLDLDFQVPMRCELDLRVRYLGGGDLLADRAEVLPQAPDRSR